MTQQLPTAIISPTVKTVMLGPGALIHWDTLHAELQRYHHHMIGKRLMIHPKAAIVEDYHAETEAADGRLKMGSTGKGVGDAMIERIRRDAKGNIAAFRHPEWAANFVVTATEYRDALDQSENLIIEGAQGFSLSIYHGAYPFTTSRDVTPWQIAADCGIPMKWVGYIAVIGTLRTYPIRVNNRDGSSGPTYPDQKEITWDQIGVAPELTTVTKLPRRLFTFSHQQYQEAMWHCGSYWKTRLFLNFANYLKGSAELDKLIWEIEKVTMMNLNAAKVEWIGFGADDLDVMTRGQYDAKCYDAKTRENQLAASDSEGGEA